MTIPATAANQSLLLMVASEELSQNKRRQSNGRTGAHCSEISIIFKFSDSVGVRRTRLRRDFVVMLGGVKTKNVLSLTGAGIDCA
jgi:hypothetical protein